MTSEGSCEVVGRVVHGRAEVQLGARYGVLSGCGMGCLVQIEACCVLEAPCVLVGQTRSTCGGLMPCSWALVVQLGPAEVGFDLAVGQLLLGLAGQLLLGLDLQLSSPENRPPQNKQKWA